MRAERKAPGCEEVVGTVLRAAPHLEIAHHIPGRIRLRILASGLELVRQLDVEGAASGLPGVRGIRVNPFARSVVVDYLPDRIPPQLWGRLAELRVRPGLEAEIAEELRAVWDSVEPAVPKKGG